MTLHDRLNGCIIGGAIGDAWGSAFQFLPATHSNNTFIWGKQKQPEKSWAITDDTQLTLISLEALSHHHPLSPETLSQYFLRYYLKKQITGIGASTLQALKALEVGAHWSLAGKSGDYAAGNGAAVRIAPVAFWKEYGRDAIRDFCRITHRNEEAYVGALAIVMAIRLVLSGQWNGENNLIQLLLPQLPDVRVKDRLQEIDSLSATASIHSIAALGVSGYVVDSVPFTIYAASQVKKLGFHPMMEQIIQAGGDTDTHASLAGQIAGTLLGREGLTGSLINKLSGLEAYNWISETLLNVAINDVNWQK